MLQQMLDGRNAVTAAATAERAVAKLVEFSADLRACALVAADGTVLASSGQAPWSERTVELWTAAEAVREDGNPATQVQVSGEGGEVFATRSEGITAIAVTDRFALASLMFCDLRAALRDLAAATG